MFENKVEIQVRDRTKRSTATTKTTTATTTKSSTKITTKTTTTTTTAGQPQYFMLQIYLFVSCLRSKEEEVEKADSR